MTTVSNMQRPLSLTETPNKVTKHRSLAKTIGRLDFRQLGHTGKQRSPSATKMNGNAAAAADDSRYDAHFKVVLLGESGVGKTSLIRAAIGEPFNPTMISTIGIDFVTQTYNVDNYRIQLQIWDTAGQERYRSLAASTFRDAKGFIIVYDVTNRASYAKIREEWLKMTDTHSGEPVPVFFVGNKADLTRLKEVPIEEAQKFSQQQYAHGFFETSALSGANVQALFQSVATSMVSTWSLPQFYYNSNPSFNHNAPFRLSDQTPQAQANAENVGKKRRSVFQCCAT